MEMAVARLEVNLPGPEVVRAGQEVARAIIKYNSNLFWALGRDWKSEIWHAGVVGHGNGSGQVGGEFIWPTTPPCQISDFQSPPP